MQTKHSITTRTQTFPTPRTGMFACPRTKLVLTTAPRTGHSHKRAHDSTHNSQSKHTCHSTHKMVADTHAKPPNQRALTTTPRTGHTMSLLTAPGTALVLITSNKNQGCAWSSEQGHRVPCAWSGGKCPLVWRFGVCVCHHLMRRVASVFALAVVRGVVSAFV